MRTYKFKRHTSGQTASVPSLRPPKRLANAPDFIEMSGNPQLDAIAVDVYGPGSEGRWSDIASINSDVILENFSDQCNVSKIRV